MGIPAYDRLKPEVRLWPNPVNDVRCTLNVRNLAPGTYIAHVETKAGISDVKFVVGRN